MSDRVNIHATGVVLGRTGVLLRGPAGAGKSLLTLELIEWFTIAGNRAVLVADDRLDLAVEAGRLIMHAPPRIAGLIELRGRGIVTRPHVGMAEVGLVVDLVETLERMLEEDQFSTELLGVVVPRCPVPRHGVAGPAHQRLLVTEALRALAQGARDPALARDATFR